MNMSMHAYHYVILGYDFSKNRDKIIDDDWKWTPEGEEWTCRASKGNIQMFTDINDGYDLYFGYVVATMDEDTSMVQKIQLEELMEKKKLVEEAMKKLNLPFPEDLPEFQLIIITDWS